MIAPFDTTRFDPITERQISCHCWNTHHKGTEYHDASKCAAAGCKCMCHDDEVVELDGPYADDLGGY